MTSSSTSGDSPPPYRKHHFYDVAKKVLDVIHNESECEAHTILKNYIGNKQSKRADNVPGVVHPSATGVIYCTDR
jgi:hypothetical protein